MWNCNERREMKERHIIFSHKRAVGDALMFTCGVRDFKLLFPKIQITVNTSFPEVFENNPFVDYVIKADPKKIPALDENGVEHYRVGYPVINNANAANTHFSQAFLFDMIASADYHEPLGLSLYELMSAFANGRIGDPDIKTEKTINYKEKKNGGLTNLPESMQDMFENKDSICQLFARIRPDIYLTDGEKKDFFIRKNYGAERYWVVAPGGKRDCTCKIWDWRRFQKVVDHYKGYIKFVVIGRSDHLLEKINGVIDLTDKFNGDLRKLFPLVYHADGCISGISLLHHLCAAMPNKINPRIYPKPCITIYGGREPITFTLYNQTYPLHTNGAFHCCEYGGCWHSRIVPLPKDPDKNKRLCKLPVEDNNRMIQQCMDVFTADDVIRQLEIIYGGNVLKTANPVTKPIKKKGGVVRVTKQEMVVVDEVKEINILASMKTDGGGEQSALNIAKLLRDARWKVNFYPWAQVHKKFKDEDIEGANFMGIGTNMAEVMKSEIPLLLYGNDNVNGFVEHGQKVVEKAKSVVVGINYVNGWLPKCEDWLRDKLKAVIFQNEEKMMEFERDQIALDHVQKIVLFGAINLDKMVDVCTEPRKDGSKLVVLKHCKPDYRKYVTTESEGKGDKIHIWQKQFAKENDMKFYARLLSDVKDVNFEFMQAPDEISKTFKDVDRMKFWTWDEIPVTEFLSRGHVYLYRTSNLWRDQYPRVIAEALAAGLPVIGEPRDGVKDRIIHGNNGFYATHYDEYLLALKTLKRKEKLRSHMGQYAKDWARMNLDPKKWVEVLEDILFN